MQLQSGSTLSSYEIVAPLGAGGMGEVYRARDPKLERDVAIKVLPADLADDPERLARFEREAKTLGALNHPNIATVHGFESERDTHFLVMELVDGEDFATRLKRGPLPVDQAIPLFIQIAEGLEAAHEKGIIHRDLKPANIMLTRDGRAKVLDFGLARSAEPSSGDVDLSQSPTRTELATTGGQILGTAAYMSPEQAKGEVVDKRTDVWSFGVCLYEALAGQGPFPGKTVAELIAAILKGEPDWDALPAETPPVVHRILRRCLIRNPQKRQRSLGDVVLDLEDGLDDEHSAAQEAIPRARDTRPAWAAALIMGIVIGGMTVWGWQWAWPGIGEGSPDPVVRFSFDSEGQDGGTGDLMALSPDAKTIVFRVQHGNTFALYRRDLNASTAVKLQDWGMQPFFSPDGRHFGFFERRGLMRMPLSGGPAVPVTSIAGWPTGGTWLEDGRIVFATTAAPGLLAVDSSGGSPTTLPDLDARLIYRWPQSFAGGRALVASAATADGSASTVTVVSVDPPGTLSLFEGDYPRVLENDSHDAYLLFWRRGNIWAVGFDTRSFATEGTPVAIVENVNRWAGAVGLAVSRSGSIAYSTPALQRLVWLERDGTIELVLPELATYRAPRLSPNGRRLMYSRYLPEGDEDIFLLDLDGRSLPERLTTRDGPDGSARWGPTAESLTYVESRPASRSFVRAQARVGANPNPDVLLEEVLDAYPSTWDSAGQRLLYTKMSADSSWDIWLHEPSQPNRPLLSTPAFESDGEFSPDGEWMAFTSDRSGSTRVYVAPFADLSKAKPVSDDGGRYPVWAPSGSSLYYRTDTHIMQVERIPETHQWRSPETVVAAPRAASGLMRDFDLAPDGRFVLYLESDQTRKINVVLNLDSELERRQTVE